MKILKLTKFRTGYLINKRRKIFSKVHIFNKYGRPICGTHHDRGKLFYPFKCDTIPPYTLCKKCERKLSELDDQSKKEETMEKAKIYKFTLNFETNCPKCKNKIKDLYIYAADDIRAKDNFRLGDGMCESCFFEEEVITVVPTRVDQIKHFNSIVVKKN